MSKSDCAVCRLVRFYLLVAVPLIAIVGFSATTPDGDLAGVYWFARVELIDFLAYGALLALFAVVAFRIYKEFWLPKRRERHLSQLLDTFDRDQRE